MLVAQSQFLQGFYLGDQEGFLLDESLEMHPFDPVYQDLQVLIWQFDGLVYETDDSCFIYIACSRFLDFHLPLSRNSDQALMLHGLVDQL